MNCALLRRAQSVWGSAGMRAWRSVEEPSFETWQGSKLLPVVIGGADLGRFGFKLEARCLAGDTRSSGARRRLSGGMGDRQELMTQSDRSELDGGCRAPLVIDCV